MARVNVMLSQFLLLFPNKILPKICTNLSSITDFTKLRLPPKLRCSPEQFVQIQIPYVTEAHCGLWFPHSKQCWFSSSFRKEISCFLIRKDFNADMLTCFQRWLTKKFSENAAINFQVNYITKFPEFCRSDKLIIRKLSHFSKYVVAISRSHDFPNKIFLPQF